MIRKAIIVILLFATAGTLVLWIDSESTPRRWHMVAADCVCLLLHTTQGRIDGDVITRWPPSLWPHRGQSLRIREFCFPLWAPNVAFLVLLFAAVCAPLARRLHRRKRGLCVACGYNLKGLPEPRCPECGREFER